MAAGIPDELFWRSTPEECYALLAEFADQKEDEARAAAIRSASIAAEVRNTMRSKRGQKVWTWKDFVKMPATEVSPDEAAEILVAWAKEHNQRIANA